MQGVRWITRYPGTYTVLIGLLVVVFRGASGSRLHDLAFAFLAALAAAELPLGIFYLVGPSRRPRYAIAHSSMGVAALLSAASIWFEDRALLTTIAAIVSLLAALTIAWAVKTPGHS